MIETRTLTRRALLANPMGGEPIERIESVEVELRFSGGIDNYRPALEYVAVGPWELVPLAPQGERLAAAKTSDELFAAMRTPCKS